MPKPLCALSRNLVAAASPETQALRRHEISTRPPSLKRSAQLLLHSTITKSPRSAAALFGSSYKEWGAEFVGMGTEFSVFKINDEEVLKIAHDTVLMSRQQQEAYAQRRQAEYSHMVNWLGEFTLPQSIGVEPLPFMPALTAVQVRQPFCGIQDPELFRPLDVHVHADNLATLQTNHPIAGEQLGDFAERSLSLHGAEELVPDINGEANLVVSEGSLIMIDGQPVGNEHSEVQKIIVGQLHSLQMALA